jgi:putative spermidine/putrescine transport system substrate-binding protein
MDRRSFLTKASGLLLSTALTGCSGSAPTELRVRVLKGSIPAQLPSEFLKQAAGSIALNFKPESPPQRLFNLLQTWQQPVPSSGWALPFSIPFIYDKSADVVPDLVTLGDYWLTIAIRQNLIQPLNLAQQQQWQQLPTAWRQHFMRNDQGELAAQGQIWGAPYRWGSTVMVYNRDIFRQKNLPLPTDWGDLWRPDLKGQIALLDQPREVIGLTLKKLGYSYNTPDLNAVPNLEQELRTLGQQVKFYSSDHYLQSLILGDTWLAVGWSSDVLNTLRQNPAIAAIVPLAGTALWADLWVQPRLAPAKADWLTQWIEFCWQPATVAKLAEVSRAASPMLVVSDRAKLPASVQSNALLLPDAAILDRSEFLAPLTATTAAQYRAQWETLRQKQ